MRENHSALVILVFFIGQTLTACGSYATQPHISPTVESYMFTPTFTPLPSPVPLPAETAFNTQTPYSTETPVSASQIQGEWHKYSRADGFCTDSPLFIGHSFIGTGTTTLCFYNGDGSWSTKVVPQGMSVTAVNIFPPGGGWIVATDVGICSYAFQEWRCQTQADGFPYGGIRALVPLGPEPVYMLQDAVVFNKISYRLPDIVGAADAIPTWLAVSGEFNGEGFLPPEIWVGTNEYGIVVIQPGTGNITRYTTNDGLPSNVIRDINTEHCPKYCDFRDVWVATDEGLAHWDGTNWIRYTTANGLPSNDVRGVSSGQRNTMWVATAVGVAYFDGNFWKVYTHDNGLPEGDINGVLCQGNEILFSTRSSGLLVFTLQSP